MDEANGFGREDDNFIHNYDEDPDDYPQPILEFIYITDDLEAQPDDDEEDDKPIVSEKNFGAPSHGLKRSYSEEDDDESPGLKAYKRARTGFGTHLAPAISPSTAISPSAARVGKILTFSGNSPSSLRNSFAALMLNNNASPPRKNGRLVQERSYSQEKAKSPRFPSSRAMQMLEASLKMRSGLPLANKFSLAPSPANGILKKGPPTPQTNSQSAKRVVFAEPVVSSQIEIQVMSKMKPIPKQRTPRPRVLFYKYSANNRVTQPESQINENL